MIILLKSLSTVFCLVAQSVVLWQNFNSAMEHKKQMNANDQKQCSSKYIDYMVLSIVTNGSKNAYKNFTFLKVPLPPPTSTSTRRLMAFVYCEDFF